MVHKSSNKIIDSGIDKVEKNSKAGIHKYTSTGEWVKEYDKAVDDMNKAIDEDYKESEKLQGEAEDRTSKLQEEEEMEAQKEEDQLYVEQLRQVELEKARAEVEAIKKQSREASRPEIVPVVEEQKPSLKERVRGFTKRVAGVVGVLAGAPEVAVASQLIPNGEKKKKIVYKEKPKEELILA